VGGLEIKERKESGYNIGKKTFLLIKTLPVFAFWSLLAAEWHLFLVVA
jgi:hypothetical protein